MGKGFGIDGGVRQRCIISLCLIIVYVDELIKGLEMGVRFLEEVRT